MKAPISENGTAEVIDFFEHAARALLLSSSSSDVCPVTYLNDAEIWGEMSAEVADLPIAISVAEDQFAKEWRTVPEARFEDVFEGIFSTHPRGKKEGRCFVTGTLGQKSKRRIKGNVIQNYLMGLDVDSGASLHQMFERVRQSGLTALFYTTHSHGSDEIEISHDKFHRWAIGNNIDTSPTSASLRRYLSQEGRYVADICMTAEFVEKRQEDGMKLVVKTRPIDKFRVIFPLAQPFNYSQQKSAHSDALKLWEAKVLGLGRSFGVEVDRAARDASRCFYLPRHAHNATDFKIMLACGRLLTFEEIDAADSREPVSSGIQFITPSGFNLRKWARERANGFDIAKAFRDYAPERIRQDGSSSDKITVECPFDHDHSNPGDPDDKGCFVESAGHADTFAFHCSHHACHGRDRLDFIQESIRGSWLPETVLVDESYYACLPEVDESRENSVARNADDIERAIRDAVEQKGRDGHVAADTMNALMNGVAREANRVPFYDRIKTLRLTGLTAFRSEVEKRAKAIMKSAGKARQAGQGKVYSDTDFREVIAQVKEALSVRNTPPYMFSYGDRLVRADASVRLKVEPMSERDLRYEATEAVDYRKLSGDDDIGERIPRDIAEHLIDDPVKAFAQPLRRVTYAPMVAPDGSVVARDGCFYDDHLQILVDARGLKMPRVARAPSEIEVDLALRVLEKVVAEFPFTDDFAGGKDSGRSSKANALGFILTPFLRDHYSGCTPLVLLDKSKPGSGGGFLAEVAYMISHGDNIAGSSLPSTEDEIRKQITTYMLAGDTFKIWDNVNRRIDSATLAALLTMPIWVDRELGRNSQVKIPNLGMVVVTGNNISMSDEITRRCIPIRLDTGLASNDVRKFKRRAPLRSLLRMRGYVVWACLGSGPIKGFRHAA